MTKSIVSVVIPTFKGGQRIAQALSALHEQTYKNIEVIIVDDGSPEEHLDAIRVAAKGYARTKVVRLPVNQGASAARNVGIRNSNGEFVAFLDDDDRWYPEKLERQVERAREAEDIGLVGCGMNQRFEGESLSYTSLPSKVEIGFSDLIIENYFGGTSSALVRAKALHDVGGFDLQLSAREEYDLWLRISKRWRIVILPIVLMDYFHDLSRETRVSNAIKSYVKACAFLNMKWEDEIGCLPKRVKKKRLGEQYFFLGAQAIKAGCTREAWHWFRKSFGECPSGKSLAGVVMAPLGYRRIIRLRGTLSRA